MPPIPAHLRRSKKGVTVSFFHIINSPFKIAQKKQASHTLELQHLNHPVGTCTAQD